VAIGAVSFFYCGECPGLPSAFTLISLVTVTTIYTFYKRHRQFKEIMTSNPGLNRSRYFRLMAISAVEICGTVPLATFYIVINAKSGVVPWKSWADTHSNYSTVNQIAGFIWKNDPTTAKELELFRWSLIVCSFVFFGLFGFADEARQHYRRVYTTLASRIGYSTFTLQGSSNACVVLLSIMFCPSRLIGCSVVIWFCSSSSVPYVKSKGGVNVSVVTTGDLTRTDKRRSSVSFSDQPSTVPSISLATDFKSDLKVEEYSPSNSMASASVESFIDPAMHDQLPDLPAGIQSTFPPASFLPLRTHSGAEAV